MEREFCTAAKEIMKERFGHDNVVALATQCGGMPYVRYVNAYYEDGSFYVITYVLSEKMRHIGETPIVAIAGEWFNGHGVAENLGWFSAEKNRAVAEKLRRVLWSGSTMGTMILRTGTRLYCA
jgi:Pyridoxamine 5''-phosphate oxidase.